MNRAVPGVALAVLALLGCGGPSSSDRPGVLAELEPAAVTLNRGPVRLTSCRDEGDGHITFTGVLRGKRPAERPWEVDVQVVRRGVLIEVARAFPAKVPKGTAPVKVVGSGTLYVGSDNQVTCDVLTANPLSRVPTTPSR